MAAQKPCNSNCRHDSTLIEIFSSRGGSVPHFIDDVFTFIANHKPEALTSSSGIAVEHIVGRTLGRCRAQLNLRHQECATHSNSATHERLSTNISLPADSPCALVAEEVEVVAENTTETDSTSAVNRTKVLYHWSQTVEDLDIRIPVPPSVNKGKQVSLSIKPDHVRVGLVCGVELLSGSFVKPVEVHDCLWDLSPGDCITLHLTKREAEWWPPETGPLVGVLGELEGARQPERQFNALPNDEQADIRRIVFDAEQRAAGKPTSDVLKTQAMLRQAWDAEGSPFKGSPFDLSKINLSSHGHFP